MPLQSISSKHFIHCHRAPLPRALGAVVSNHLSCTRRRIKSHTSHQFIFFCEVRVHLGVGHRGASLVTYRSSWALSSGTSAAVILFRPFRLRRRRLEDFAAAPAVVGSDVSPAASEVSDRLGSRAGSASASSDRAAPLTGAVSATGSSTASNCLC